MRYPIFDKVHKIELPILFPLKTTNVYFVDDAPRTLIDTDLKTETSFGALKRGIEDIGFSLHAVERIVVTHGHIDHYGQAKQRPTMPKT